MKFLTGLSFAILFIVYGFAVHMTSVEPDKVIWGYICTVIFGITFTWGVSIMAKNQGKNKDENKESNS